jgi:hypothetical protein
MGDKIALKLFRETIIHMDAVFLTMGGILIPLGFYLKIEQPQLDDVGTASVITGLVVWLLAYYTVKRKEKRERIDRQTERQEDKRLLSDILQELRKLNQGK